MRLPVYASLRLDTRWRGFRQQYTPPVPSAYYPGQFLSQGDWSLEFGPVRVVVVFSN